MAIADKDDLHDAPLSAQPISSATPDSERRLAAIFDHSLEFIGLLSPQGTLIEANQAALAFAGAMREEVIGCPFWGTPWWTNAPDPRAGERVHEAVAAAARGAVVRFEMDCRHYDGRVATFDVSITPVHDSTGRVTFLIPEGRDITQRKRAEEALRFLAEADVLLASSLDYETTLTHVVERCVPYLADWCSAVGLDRYGVMRRLASAHHDATTADVG
jgi:PAS domain S-box-containing protein